MNIKWDITYKCNLNCDHCINGGLLGHLDNELNINEIEIILEKLKKVNVEYVHLLGGEPTARRDFVEVMQAFDSKGIKFGFNTNGLKMNNMVLLNEVIRNEHLKNIVFSVEGPTAEVNDAIRGKNVFDHTVKNIENFVKLKTDNDRNDIVVTINTVLSRKNLNYISEMIDFCIKLGVNEFVLLQLIVGGNAKEEDAITFEEELKVIELIANKYPSIKDRLNIVPRFTTPMAQLYASEVLNKEFPAVRMECGAGVDFGYLNNKGELYSCDRYKSLILEKNDASDICLVNNDFWDIFSKEGYDEAFIRTEGKEFYKHLSPCNRCKYLQKSCFPCPATLDSKKETLLINCDKFYSIIEERKCN